MAQMLITLSSRSISIQMEGPSFTWRCEFDGICRNATPKTFAARARDFTNMKVRAHIFPSALRSDGRTIALVSDRTTNEPYLSIGLGVLEDVYAKALAVDLSKEAVHLLLETPELPASQAPLPIGLAKLTFQTL